MASLTNKLAHNSSKKRLYDTMVFSNNGVQVTNRKTKLWRKTIVSDVILCANVVN